jgi:hypothetical protein
MGLASGRMEGRQRGGESSRGGGRIGLLGAHRSGLGGGGIAGSGFGPLTLVAGAKKLLQDVSEDASNGIPAFPHDTNVLTGRALSHDCTTTNGRPDGGSNGAHGLSRTSPSLTALLSLGSAEPSRDGKDERGEKRMWQFGRIFVTT